MTEHLHKERPQASFFEVLREDVKMFRLAHPEHGWLKYVYYPDIRTVFIFRLSTLFYQYRILRPLAYFLTLVNDLIAGVWIGPKVKVGPGLFFGHARGLVVNPETKIGKYCSILQRVTIGGPNVVIGDYVEINSGVNIISNVRGKGFLRIGDNVIIGAGAVVVHDVQDCSVVVGVPARVVKTISPDDNWVAFRRKRNQSAVLQEPL